jgi:hypothetical protein
MMAQQSQPQTSLVYGRAGHTCTRVFPWPAQARPNLRSPLPRCSARGRAGAACGFGPGVPAGAPQDASRCDAQLPTARLGSPPFKVWAQPPCGTNAGPSDSEVTYSSLLCRGPKVPLPASQPGLLAAPSLPESDDSDARRRSNAGGIKPPACAACCMCVADSTSATKLRRRVLQRGAADATCDRPVILSESLWARAHRCGDLRLDARIGVPELLRSASLDACGVPHRKLTLGEAAWGGPSQRDARERSRFALAARRPHSAANRPRVLARM